MLKTEKWKYEVQPSSFWNTIKSLSPFLDFWVCWQSRAWIHRASGEPSPNKLISALIHHQWQVWEESDRTNLHPSHLIKVKSSIFLQLEFVCFDSPETGTFVPSGCDAAENPVSDAQTWNHGHQSISMRIIDQWYHQISVDSFRFIRKIYCQPLGDNFPPLSLRIESDDGWMLWTTERFTSKSLRMKKRSISSSIFCLKSNTLTKW